MITVTVSDGVLTSSDQFTVTANPPPNTAPTITDIANQTVTVGQSTGALAFTVGDAQTPAGSLVLTATTGNASVVPAGSIVLGGSGANRTVTVTPSSQGSAVITVTVSDGVLTSSDTFVVTATSLVAPWRSTDIGPVGMAGAASQAADAFELRADGTGADAIHYVYQPLIGDMTLTAFAAEGPLLVAGSQMGLMIRTGLGQGDPFVAQSFRGSRSEVLVRSSAAGAIQAGVFSPFGAGPHWLRITRRGSRVTVYHSNDPSGTSWNETSAVDIPLGGTPVIGMYGSSGDPAVLATMRFTNVMITGGVQNTAPTITPIPRQTITLTAGSGPIPFTIGDAETPAALLQVTATTSRPDLIPVGNIVLAGAGSMRTVAVSAAGSQSGIAHIDLVVSDGSQSRSTSFIVTVNAPSGLPVGWSAVDVGAQLAGASTFDFMFWRIAGAGRDIMDQADEFRFAYRTVTGNATITAFVESMDGTDPWAKAGIMIRADATPDSPHAMMMVSPGSGVAFLRRTQRGGATVLTSGNGESRIRELRLSRVGNELFGYEFQVGIPDPWVLVGQATLPDLPATVLIGLAVTSRNPEVRCEATFQRVQVSQP